MPADTRSGTQEGLLVLFPDANAVLYRCDEGSPSISAREALWRDKLYVEPRTGLSLNLGSFAITLVRQLPLRAEAAANAARTAIVIQAPFCLICLRSAATQSAHRGAAPQAVAEYARYLVTKILQRQLDDAAIGAQTALRTARERFGASNAVTSGFDVALHVQTVRDATASYDGFQEAIFYGTVYCTPRRCTFRVADTLSHADARSCSHLQTCMWLLSNAMPRRGGATPESSCCRTSETASCGVLCSPVRVFESVHDGKLESVNLRVLNGQTPPGWPRSGHANVYALPLHRVNASQFTMHLELLEAIAKLPIVYSTHWSDYAVRQFLATQLDARGALPARVDESARDHGLITRLLWLAFEDSAGGSMPSRAVRALQAIAGVKSI